MLRGNNKLLSLLLLFSSFLAARATSDSDLINSEVGLTAKQWGWVREGRGMTEGVDEWATGTERGRGRGTHSFCCGLCAVCWGKL